MELGINMNVFLAVCSGSWIQPHHDSAATSPLRDTSPFSPKLVRTRYFNTIAGHTTDTEAH